MKPALILIAIAATTVQAASPASEFVAGRSLYTEGRFKEAALHFQRALGANPDDAEACYWAGVAYQRQADIATPFGGSYQAKARRYLTKAMELAPAESKYRQALFDHLLDSAGTSRTALRDAERILRAVPESDPAYGGMRSRFEFEKQVNSSANARLGWLFLAVPRLAYRAGALSGAALTSRSGAVSLAPRE